MNNYLTILFISATEIQNIQIGEGNVCTNLPIPIYMIFPRLFTCPTLSTSNFKVGKNIIWIFFCNFYKNFDNKNFINYLLQNLKWI